MKTLGFPVAAGLLVVLALALRLVFFLSHRAALPFLDHPILDAALYDAWARSLAEGRSFVEGPFYQSPGYPYALSLVYRLFGAEPLAGVVLNALLGSGTVLLTALLGKRLFGAREGMLAGLLVAGSGIFLFLEGKLLTEPLATFLGVLSVHALLSAETSGRPSRYALAGLSAGALGVVRANLLLFAAVVGVALLVRTLRRRLPWPSLLAFAAAVALAILPATVHNARHGALAPVAVQGGYNFYAGNHAGATGVYENIPGIEGGIESQEAEIDSLVRAETGRRLSPDATSRYWTRRALGEIAGDPIRWLRLAARKAWLFVNRQEETVNGSWALESSRVPVLRFLAVPFNLVAGLGLAGLVLASRGGRSLAGPAALLGAVAASALLFFVMSRIRIPALPILAVLSAYAAGRAWDAWRSRQFLPPAVGMAVLAAFVALSWRSPLGEAKNYRWESRIFLETARSMELRSDLDGAARALREALTVDPASVEATRRLGDLAMRRGDLDGALAAFEQAARLAPADAALRSNLGILYFTASRLDACVREMEAALGLDPRLAAPYLYRGLARQMQGDPGATEDLEAALERDPGLSRAYVALVRAYLDRGDAEAARRWSEAARARGIELPK